MILPFVIRNKMVSDLNIKLGAYAAFESGFSNQGKLKASEKNVSANKRGFAFYNDTALFATISNTADDITYGTKIIADKIHLLLCKFFHFSSPVLSL